MTAEDNYFWTFNLAISYYRFELVRYIGFHDKGIVLAGGCGGSSGKRCLTDTPYLKEAYEFGKSVYQLHLMLHGILRNSVGTSLFQKLDNRAVGGRVYLLRRRSLKKSGQRSAMTYDES